MSHAPDPRRWRILGVLCLSLFVVMVDNTILNVAIPSLLKDLDATTSDVQWVIDAYSLVFAGLLITAGGLGDRYGRRRAMLIGFALFGAGSLLAAFAADPAQLVAMRALMGLGGALLMPGTLSIMAQVFGPDERAKAFAIWGATSMVGLAAGPTLGGFLLEHFWWGSAFLVNVPITGAAALALFVLWQHRNPEPMLDLGLLRRRAFSGAATMIAMFGFALAGVMFALTQLLQLVLGYGPLKAGLALLPVAVSAGAGNGLGASLESRYGARPALITGFAVLAAGLAALGLTDPHEGYAVLAAGLVVLGLGAGIGTPAAYSTLMAAVPPEEAGVGSAVNDAGQELGSALGVAVLGSVVSAGYAAGLPDGVSGPARDSLGAALATGDPGLARAAKDAFADAVAAGSLTAAGVMLAAAVFAAFVMRGVARPAAADVPQPVRT